MNIAVNFKAVIIGAKTSEYTLQNGQKGTSYSICIESSGEAANFACSDKVFSMVVNEAFPKYVLTSLYGEFNSNYKRLKIVDLKRLKSE